MTGSEMIEICMPGVIRVLTEQLARERKEHADDVREAEASARGEAFLSAPLVSALRDEVSRLKEQLTDRGVGGRLRCMM